MSLPNKNVIQQCYRVEGFQFLCIHNLKTQAKILLDKIFVNGRLQLACEKL